MRDQYRDGPDVLLVAVDGLDTSLRAGAYAAGLARRQRARLVVLYVRPFSAVAGIGAGAATSMQEAYDSVAAELRQTAGDQGARLGIDIVFVERDGNPFAEIVRLADEIQAERGDRGRFDHGRPPVRRLPGRAPGPGQPLARHGRSVRACAVTIAATTS